MPRSIDKNVVKRYVVSPDKHFPLHDQPALNCLIKAIEIIKPHGYIDLGDIIEAEGCSHWQWRKKRRPPLEYQLPFVEADIDEGNAGLDMIDEVLDKVNCKIKYCCQGNHDEWLDRFVEENPFLKELEFKKALKLAERGYTYYPVGKILKIGKLNFYHGHQYSGIQHTRTHLLRMGANIMYGHHHDIQQTSVTHLDGPKSAWAIGCLKDMNAEANKWLGNRQVNWGHAFSIVDYYDKGMFTVSVINILNGRMSLWGELIDGN
jgi:hypothetical protein|tara:strand:- start:741 stop:1526 length:786 start_codon:yes stop_codon:yes gene_type:complete